MEESIEEVETATAHDMEKVGRADYLEFPDYSFDPCYDVDSGSARPSRDRFADDLLPPKCGAMKLDSHFV